MTTTFTIGDRVKFTNELDINDFATSKRTYLRESFDKVFTIKRIDENDGTEIYLDDISLDDCFFKPKELQIAVEDSILTPKEYIEQFDNVIFRSLKKICQLKGIELESSSELLSDIRGSIIEHMANYNMDISIPSYRVGDTIYVDNEECKIISLGRDDDRFGILSVIHYNVIADCYATDLNVFIKDLYNEGRIE